MSSKDFLFEIGTEELPPKALRSLSLALKQEIEKGLANASLSHSGAREFATPRRLAVRVKGLPEIQPDQTLEKFGPAVKAAFDASGKPTPAALGFARSCGVPVDDLGEAVLDGVNKLVFRSVQKGRDTVSLLPGIVAEALNALPVPKRMRWGSSKVEFVRPVHWVVMLLGENVVDTEILGVRSGRESRGHRFHHPAPIPISDPAKYESSLQNPGSVVVDFEQRREMVRSLVLSEAAARHGTVAIDEDLLDEVTSLVEWPVALTGSFDAHFLALPPEALVSSLRAHQKCFTLNDRQGKLLPNFITVSNLRSLDPSQVVSGNEKVIRPRLSDARFFFETDKKRRLEDRLETLKGIVFQQQLGSVYDKCQRVAALAGLIADSLGASRESCVRAALLSKCDLVTNMVGEFAELQGIMGYYYASADGESPEVAQAINEHYMPRFSGDELPASVTGSILAIADKLDVIAGLFALGQPPSGSKDPFALRRAAIGILRILVTRQFDLNLKQLVTTALQNFAFLKPAPEVATQVFEFMLERFRAWYQDEGIDSEVFQAVFVLQPVSPVDFHSRVLAVHHFSSLPQAQSLSSANKRVSNILGKLETAPESLSVNPDLLSQPAEVHLARLLAQKNSSVTPLFSSHQYREGLEQLAGLKDAVDAFFDQVLVMDEDLKIRNNRLALLAGVRKLFLQVADISYLQGS